VQTVKIQDERRQALAYFACMTFADGVRHTGLYLSRDYLLELLNHSSKLNPYIPLYPGGGITPRNGCFPVARIWSRPVRPHGTQLAGALT